MNNYKLIYLFIIFFQIQLQAQTINDDFEGNGNITSWTGDNCGMDNQFTNPYQSGINGSLKVLKYSDFGGQYANVKFDTPSNFNLTNNSLFSLKIYVSSSGLTGNQVNKISLKLQNNNLSEPWTTQCEIVKPILLNQWQTITFNFETDAYINLNSSSGNPLIRNDFNRVLLQVNGENNTDQVIAFIDDFLYNFNAVNFNNLVWSDEFNTSGSINVTNWHHQTQFIAGNSWANGEVQHYTNRLVNANVNNGILNIVAKKEVFTDQGQTKQYTSARLNSKYAFRYGRVEVRAKMPTGVGTFPAIWMLGKTINEPGGYWSANFGTQGWPNCGEIDIIEHWGNNQDFVQSAIHTPSSYGSTINYGGRAIANASTQFHVYALDWTAQKLIFSVDGIVHYIYNPTIKNASTWPFDAEQYILLNSAILPNITPSFVQSTFEIDYVRVYQQSALNTDNQELIVNFEIYPNPAKDKITILSNHKLESYSIIDLQGKTVLKQDFSTNEIDVNNLQDGMYVLKIISNNQIIAKKFIKN